MEPWRDDWDDDATDATALAFFETRDIAVVQRELIRVPLRTLKREGRKTTRYEYGVDVKDVRRSA